MNTFSSSKSLNDKALNLKYSDSRTSKEEPIITGTESETTIAWEGALTCPCGRPYILLKVDEVQISKNKELQPLAAYVRCPIHRRVRRIFLPYSRLSEWISAVGNRFFRCNICGEPAQPKKSGIKGHFTVVLLECPTHGIQDNKRILWSPIYSSAKAVNEIQITEALPLQDLFEEPEGESALICPRCQTENDEDARFCAYCGAQLNL
jgi:hypothetical protein